VKAENQYQDLGERATAYHLALLFKGVLESLYHSSNHLVL
jgi:hypothetical protein